MVNISRSEEKETDCFLLGRVAPFARVCILRGKS